MDKKPGPKPDNNLKDVGTVARAIRLNCRLSPRQLERRIGFGRLRIIHLAAAAGHRWSAKQQTWNSPENILPHIIDATTKAAARGVLASDIAKQNRVGIDTVIGIKTGRYERHSKRVQVGSTIRLYDEKGYEPSGKSIKGAIELSDDGGQLKCHECGGWFENLSAHALYDHKLKAREYKIKHGLKLGASLVNEERRLKMSLAAVKNGLGSRTKTVRASVKLAAMRARGVKVGHRTVTAEYRNLHGNCAVQIAHDLCTLATRLHRRPTNKEINLAGISLAIIRLKYGTVQKALDIVCGKTMKRKPVMRWYSDEELINLLKAFGEKNKRPPFRSDLRRGILPNVGTFQRRFGSWNKALKKAGYKDHSDGWTGIIESRVARKMAASKIGN